MKNTRKGLTLVEIIVAIAVFSIVSVAFFTSYVSMNKVVARQEEYVRFEMICYDINYYWDVYGLNTENPENSWENKYFKGNVENNIAYFDKNFNPQYYKDGAVYQITYDMTGETLTIINIKKIVKGDNKIIIEGVKCGKQWEKGVSNEN